MELSDTQIAWLNLTKVSLLMEYAHFMLPYQRTLRTFKRRLERQFKTNNNETCQAIPYDHRTKEELVKSIKKSNMEP